MSETRIPTQKRSIEKRNKIIEKGFELICEKGYHNTNTSEIAKYAEVSTGIVYQYFNDKEEILIEGVKNYSQKIMYPLINILETEEINEKIIEQILNDIIDNFIDSHTMSKKAHEELIAMSHINEKVSEIFHKSELETTENIVNLLEQNNIYLKNKYEKVHIMVGLIDNLCHEIVYHKHENLNYKIMKQEAINIIISMLKDTEN